MEYLSSLSPDCLKEKKYWDFFYLYAGQVTPGFFEYILSHRSELFRLYGEEKVRKKITDLWLPVLKNLLKKVPLRSRIQSIYQTAEERES